MDLRRFNLKNHRNLKREKCILPTGDYKAVLKNSSIERSKNKDEILTLHWSIESGKYMDSDYRTYINLSNAKSLQVFCIMIKNMGLTVNGIRDSRDLYGHKCLLKVELVQNQSHGPSNLVRYLPQDQFGFDDIPFELIVG